jgi:hypothetical protein
LPTNTFFNTPRYGAEKKFSSSPIKCTAPVTKGKNVRT